MNLALVANNVGLLWVGVEVATLDDGRHLSHSEAIEAAWKYFISARSALFARFSAPSLLIVAQKCAAKDFRPCVDYLARDARSSIRKSCRSLSSFLLVGYGTVGLAPFHAWLPDAHSEGPTPISAVLSGLLLNVALYALLRFKIVLSGNPATLNVGLIFMVLGLISLIFAAFMLYRRRDIKRMFAYSSIEHMGIIVFAFGLGGPLANFAGLLHMTMHSLTKSAIFFAIGHIAQVKGTQRLAEIHGLSSTHPVLAVGLALGVIAIAGLPPFGVFLSEFLLVTSSFARQPLLAVLLVAGMLIASAR